MAKPRVARRRGREFWASVVEAFERSSLTQEAFSQRHGVNVASLRGWLYRIRSEARKPEPTGRFLPLVAAQPAASGERSEWACRVRIGDAEVSFGELPPAGYLAELVGAIKG